MNMPGDQGPTGTAEAAGAATAAATAEERGFFVNDIGQLEIERDPTRGVHVQVISLGYSGTKKLGHMLNLRDHGFFFRHEWYWDVPGLRDMTFCQHTDRIRAGQASDEEIRRFYASYFDEVDEARRTYRVVGDSHGWPADLLQLADRFIPISAITNLVRNGLRYVWSMVNWHDRYVGQPDAWASLCRLWGGTTIYLNPDNSWFQVFPKPFRSYRIEDLTGESGCGTDALRDLIHWLDPTVEVPDEVLRERQQGHINKHDPNSHKRTPEWVWEQLTDEQRDVFIRECAEAMAAYGYEIPA